MTPEERFQRIENVLSTVSDHQAHFDEKLEAQRIRHDREIAEIRELQNAFAVGMIRLEKAQEATALELDKTSREWHRGMAELHEAQRITEEKLNALIDTVDRIIRDRNSN